MATNRARAGVRASLLAAVAVAGLALMVLAPVMVQALGLGEIQVRSKLNEPLDARISLRSLASGEAQSLQVELADADAFARAGLERPFGLSSLRFEVVPGGAGRGYVRVTTREAVTEPFLNFLVEATSTQGRVLREYTVLLDPPLYAAAAAQRAAAQTAPAQATRSTARGAVTPRAAFSGDSYQVRRGDTMYAIARRVRPDSSVGVERMMVALQNANPGAFIRGNVNLLRAGAVLRVPSSDEIAQVSRATARAEVRRQNEAWRAGDTSAVARTAPPPAQPAPEPTEPTPQPAAPTQDTVKIVGDDSSVAQPSGAASGTPIDSEIREQLNLALEQADTARRENEALSERLDEAMVLIADLRRMMEVKNEDIASLQTQIASSTVGGTVAGGQVEGSTPDTRTPDTTTPAQTPDTPTQPTDAEQTGTEQATGTPTTPPATGSESSTTVESPPESPTEQTTTSTEPEPRPTPIPPPVEPTSTLDQVLGTIKEFTTPLIEAGRGAIGNLAEQLGISEAMAGGGLGAIAALLIGGFLFARSRSRKARRIPVVDTTTTGTSTNLDVLGDGTVTGVGAASMAAATASAATLGASDMGHRTYEASGGSVGLGSTTGTGATVEAFAGDPMERVNVYLAYEQYSRAEEAVREAIARDPNSVDYRLRLLEVLHLAKNPAAFEAAAGQLAGMVGQDSSAMEQVRTWWDDMAPGRPMDFSVAQAAAEEAKHDTVDLVGGDTGQGTDMEVDFDLGFQLESGSSTDMDVTGTGRADTLDLDLGSPAEADMGERSELDLDLDLSSAALPRPGVGTEATATQPSKKSQMATQPVAPDKLSQAAAAPLEDAGLDFDLSGLAGSGGAAAATAAAAAAANSLIERASDRADTDPDSQTGLDFDLEGVEASLAASPPTGEVPTTEEPSLGGLSAERDTGAVSHLDFNLDVGAESQASTQLTGEPAQDAASAAAAQAEQIEQQSLASLSLDSLGGSSESALDLDLPGADIPTGEVLSSGEAEEASVLDFDLDGMGDSVSQADTPSTGADPAGSSSISMDDAVTRFGQTAGTGSDAAGFGNDGPDTTAMDFDLGGSEVEPGQDLNLELGDFPAGSTDAPTQSAAPESDSTLGGLDFALDASGVDTGGQPATGSSTDTPSTELGSMGALGQGSGTGADDESFRPRSEFEEDFDVSLGAAQLADAAGFEDGEPASEQGGTGLDFDLSFADSQDGGTAGAEAAGDAATVGGASTSEVDIDLSFPTGELAASLTDGLAPLDDEAAGAASRSGTSTGEGAVTQIQTEGPGSEPETVPDGEPVRTVRLAPGQRSTVRLSEDQMLDDIVDPTLPTPGTATEHFDATAAVDEASVGVDTEFIDIFGPADAEQSATAPATDLASSLGGRPGAEDDGLDEVQTKIDLAQTYLDMEDVESARGVLNEVLKEGSAEQKDTARQIISDIDD